MTATWNPVTECTDVKRGFHLRADELDQPVRWTRPRKISVSPCIDLFHDAIPDKFIVLVWAVMALAPQHTFQVPTTQDERARKLLNSGLFVASVWSEVERQAPGVGAQRVSMWPSMPLPNVYLSTASEQSGETP